MHGEVTQILLGSGLGLGLGLELGLGLGLELGLELELGSGAARRLPLGRQLKGGLATERRQPAWGHNQVMAR